MTSNSLVARTAMVCGGWPSSQWKRLGSANQTWPVALNGWVSDLSVRVWMKSADQVRMFACAANQAASGDLVSAAGATGLTPPTTSGSRRRSHRPVIYYRYPYVILCTLKVQKRKRRPAAPCSKGASQPSWPRPNRHEMIPLVGMRADDRLESTHDLLSKPAPGFSVPQRGALVGNRRQYMRRIARGRARQIHGQQRAAGRARQFRRRHRSGERPAKQLHLDSRRRRRSVHQQGHRSAGFQPPDNFHESKRIVTNHQRVNVPSRARRLAQFGKTLVRFRQGHDLQSDPASRQPRPAEFPVAQMGRNQQNAAPLFLRSDEMLPTRGLAQQLLNRQPCFIAP